MSPLFSVILPTLDRPGLLREALASVCEQTIDDFEVLIVNDGGLPLRDLPEDTRIRLVERPTPGGPAAARNAGLSTAQGRYVTFLDDDDRYRPQRLELALAGLRRSPITLCYPEGSLLLRAGTPPFVESLAETICEGGYPITAGCCAVERALVPRFNDAYLACEDWEWWLRLAQLAPVAVISEVGYTYGSAPGPRILHGEESRLAFSRRLLSDHAEYFAAHPRARAYRLKQIAMREFATGNRRGAIDAYWASFRAQPSGRAGYHVARAFLAPRSG